MPARSSRGTGSRTTPFEGRSRCTPLSYSGSWRIARDVALAGRNAALSIRFEAQDVYIVLGGHGRVTVTLAGRPAQTLNVDANRLYALEELPGVEKGLLRLELAPGVKAYSFTFG